MPPRRLQGGLLHGRYLAAYALIRFCLIGVSRWHILSSSPFLGAGETRLYKALQTIGWNAQPIQTQYADAAFVTSKNRSLSR